MGLTDQCEAWTLDIIRQSEAWTNESSVSGPGEGGPLPQKLLATLTPLPGADPEFLKIKLIH